MIVKMQNQCRSKATPHIIKRHTFFVPLSFSVFKPKHIPMQLSQNADHLYRYRINLIQIVTNRLSWKQGFGAGVNGAGNGVGCQETNFGAGSAQKQTAPKPCSDVQVQKNPTFYLTRLCSSQDEKVGLPVAVSLHLILLPLCDSI